MSDQHIDPAGNTQQFKAFAQRSEQQDLSTHRKKSPVIPIVAIVAVIVVVAVAAFLLLK
ncbi:MAG: hypothetical protein HOY71_19540 [Nonomuraea sp.]|nr:hypothetical protein [Nonomuraea sp.]